MSDRWVNPFQRRFVRQSRRGSDECVNGTRSGRRVYRASELTSNPTPPQTGAHDMRRGRPRVRSASLLAAVWGHDCRRLGRIPRACRRRIQ